MVSRPAAAFGLLALLAGSMVPRAWAQTGLSTSSTGPASGSTTTTTTTASTTTTTRPTPPAVVLPLPAPGSTTTTAPPPPPASGHPGDEVGSEEPPPTDVSVPPSATPPPPPSPALRRLVARQLKQARADLAAADRALADANARVANATAAWETNKARLAEAEGRNRAVVERLQKARRAMVQRALGAYTGEDLSQLNGLLESGDINELARRSGLLEELLHNSRQTVDDYARAKKAAGAAVVGTVAAVNASWSDLQLAQTAVQEAAQAAVQAKVIVDAIDAGSLIAVKGFVFPVAAPHKFSNDFGNPRMPGTPYAHSHQGNDIFAVMGAPLVACERGVVTRIGVDRLGGNKFWLVGQSSTAYYYAHLSAYAPGLADGQVVEAGTVLGYVGDTGNAKGGPTHLHFEVHPGGGPAVNPYFLLKAVDAAAASMPPTTAPPSSPPPSSPSPSAPPPSPAP